MKAIIFSYIGSTSAAFSDAKNAVESFCDKQLNAEFRYAGSPCRTLDGPCSNFDLKGGCLWTIPRNLADVRLSAAKKGCELDKETCGMFDHCTYGPCGCTKACVKKENGLCSEWATIKDSLPDTEVPITVEHMVCKSAREELYCHRPIEDALEELKLQQIALAEKEREDSQKQMMLYAAALAFVILMAAVFVKFFMPDQKSAPTAVEPQAPKLPEKKMGKVARLAAEFEAKMGN